jgi:hypothetical protein
VFEKDLSKLLDESPPWSPGKENQFISPGSANKEPERSLLRSKSQNKVAGSKAIRVKRVPVPRVGGLPPIAASPRPDDSRTRRPFAAAGHQNLPDQLTSQPSIEKRRSMLAELSGAGHKREKSKGKENTASQRVREWEREKQRLREMQRLEEMEQERDEELKDIEELEMSLSALAKQNEAAINMLASPEPIPIPRK